MEYKMEGVLTVCEGTDIRSIEFPKHNSIDFLLTKHSKIVRNLGLKDGDKVIVSVKKAR